jgi:hypothetical protein
MHMNMKLPLLLLLGAATTGCGSGASDGATGPLQAQLAQAADDWARAKPGCATYHYVRPSDSFTGSHSETTVEITADRPSQRRYLGRVALEDGGVEATTWDERGADVGSHHDAYDAETVEQLFAECRTAIAQDPAKNELRLVIGPHGVPTTCTFLPRNCADDCVMGVGIADFACGALPADDGGL